MHKEYAGVEGYGPVDDSEEYDDTAIVYDTVYELFTEEPVAHAWEDDSYYYVQHESDASSRWSDTGMYKIDKKTHDVIWMEYMSFMLMNKKYAKEIKPEDLKRILI